MNKLTNDKKPADAPVYSSLADTNNNISKNIVNTSNNNLLNRALKIFISNWVKLLIILVLTCATFAAGVFIYKNEYDGTAKESKAAETIYNVKNYGAKGDGITDDRSAIQNTINAASSGDTVYIPEGTYIINSSINLKSNIKLLGVIGGSILKTTTILNNFILEGESLTGITIEDLSFQGQGVGNISAGAESSVGKALSPNGIYAMGCTNCALRNLDINGMYLGFRLGGNNWNVEDITIRNCANPVFMNYISDSSFSRLDLQALGFNTNQFHGMYIERNARRLTFNDIEISADGLAGGYVLQMYVSDDGALLSGDNTFTNISIEATGVRGPMVIWGHENVTFNNLTITATDSSYPIVRTDTVNNFLFNGFTASGGKALITKYSAPEGPISNITFKNGSYYGPILATDVTITGITNLVFDNVGINSLPPIPTLSPTPTNIIAGDVDGDGHVNIVDLSRLAINFGKTSGATRAQGDLDGDGDIDIIDLSKLAANWEG